MNPKVLILDIETSLLLVETFDIFNTFISPDQIIEDWRLYSWSAKWLGESKIEYRDLRQGITLSNEKRIAKEMWQKLDEADVIVTQNGKQFDSKRLNAKFAEFGFNPPSPYKHIDTKQIAKRYFGFTSNGLEYLAKKLDLKHKKLKHAKFPGKELWREAKKGNPEAWKEMERYNKQDVLALEELYRKVAPWDTTVNLSIYSESLSGCPVCQSKRLEKRGFALSKTGKYQRYQCQDCGAWSKDGRNLFKGLTPQIKRSV